MVVYLRARPKCAASPGGSQVARQGPRTWAQPPRTGAHARTELVSAVGSRSIPRLDRVGVLPQAVQPETNPATPGNRHEPFDDGRSDNSLPHALPAVV